MSFIKIEINGGNFDPDQNFWELNPQFKYYKPYNKLFTRDKSKKQVDSSKEMWCIVFMCHPDEDINIYFRISPDEREVMLKEVLAPHFKSKDEIIKECLESFPEDVLSSVQKSFKMEKDLLRKRAIYLDSLPFNQETSKEINMLQKDALRVFENYDKLEQKFLKEKAEVRAKGGRRRTKSEKGELWGYSN